MSDSPGSEASVVESITACARRILTLLERRPETDMPMLAALLGERIVVTYQALGWLAHDRKVRYVQKGNRIFVSVRHAGPDP